jgi:large conductance mechanosensitive channel
MAAEKKATKQTTGNVTPTDLVAEAKKAEHSAERAERAASRVLEQAERLKDLDKFGVARQFSGFVNFLREQSVVGLAVGLVLGTQAKALVDQIVISFINPLVGLFLPGEGTLKDQTFWLSLGDKGATFGWGSFMLVLLNFIAVAAVIYFIVKGLKLDKIDKKKSE